MDCSECKHFEVDEEKPPCRYCEGKDKFEVPISHYDLAALRAQVSALQTEVKHWKDQHANEVKRARILKDRTDLPLERVRAYELMGELQKMVAELKAANDELNAECCRLSLAEEKAAEKGAESMRERVKAVVEKVGNNRCACVYRERCASCGTVDDILADVSALPLKENEG